MLIERTIEHTRYKRLLGRIRGEQPGPTVVAVGGMHGNEPSGVEALQAILRELEKMQGRFRGEFVALAGNLRALEAGIRFVDADLNRMWKLNKDMTNLAPVPEVYEKKEMEELQTIVDQIESERRGPLVFLDLHTTSSQSPPFILCGDTLRNRDFISDMPIPKVLGLDERLNGPFLSYLNVQGHVTVCFEAGQHTDPQAYHNHIALLWILLAKAGNLSAKDIPQLEASRKLLKEQSGRDLQGFHEVVMRYGVMAHEKFVMRPGYRNFQPIAENEHLADTKFSRVKAIISGMIFMPLYQAQGDDGFFIIRRIPRRRVRRSVWLRRLHFQALLPLFPGIRSHPTRKGMLLVNPKYYRILGPSLLHVLGFRRMKREGDRLLFIKRPYDLHGPSELDRFSR